MARLLNPAEPADDFQLRDLAYTARVMRRPRCVCCEEPILSETYLDLSAFGLNEVVCERCVDKHTHDTDDLDEDYG